MEEIKYVLDAMTNNKEYRLTAFSDSIGGLVRDYSEWMENNNLTQEDIWYADAFTAENKKHYLSLEKEGSGIVNIIPAPKDSRVNIYKRNNIRHKIDMIIKKIA